MDVVVEDYEKFKDENEKLITELFLHESDITKRFHHVYRILEFLDNKENSGVDLTSDEDVIFKTAFSYLYELFNQIEIILEKDYNNDVKELEKHAKTLNLLLYANDFQHELSEVGKESTKLNDFADLVLGYLQKHEDAPEELFCVLDDITFGLFDEDYYGVSEIFLDIAEEMGLADFDDDTYVIDK